jgi:hypothetical protein
MSNTDVIVVETRERFHAYKRHATVPFDRFYLVKESDIACARQLTPFSIVLPLTDAYTKTLSGKGLDVPDLMQKEYRVVVPILMTRVVGARGNISSNEVQPSYMTKKGWFRHHRVAADFIPEDVRMITPTGMLNPMCASCENSLAHLSGECRVGGPDCLVSLKFDSPTMDEAKRAKREPKEHETLALIAKINSVAHAPDDV